MYSKNDYRSSSYLREIKFKNTKGYTAEQGMNRTETRVKISTSASNFHKSLRENTSKFGESKSKCQSADDDNISNYHRYGIMFHLHLNLCMEDGCNWNKFFYTSKEMKSDNPGASSLITI